MEEEIINIISEYGLEAVILGLVINVLTGLLKIPIKTFTKKLEDGSKVTRYLVFLPIILGFCLTLGYMAATKGEIDMTKEFITLWLSSSSLSLTFYALWEKLFPAKEKLKKEYIVEENEKLLEAIRRLTGSESETEAEEKRVKDPETREVGKSVSGEKSVAETEERKNDGKKRKAYEEMIFTMNQMQGGVPEGECYENYGKRCGISCYRKLGTMLSQNLKKGSGGLSQLLEREAQESFEDRKNLAKKLGEEAGTKLMIPMFLMLIIVFAIVIIPAFFSIRI